MPDFQKPTTIHQLRTDLTTRWEDVGPSSVP